MYSLSCSSKNRLKGRLNTAVGRIQLKYQIKAFTEEISTEKKRNEKLNERIEK
jgi:hypothetical protein